MKRSIQSKILTLFISLLGSALLISAVLLIWMSTNDLRREIYQNALTFADLTNEQVVQQYEQFYVPQNFLQFRKVVNPLLGQSEDIANIEIVGKSGELLYEWETEQDVPAESARNHDYELERTRDIKPSLLFSNGEVIFVRRNAQQQWIPVDENGNPSEFPNGEVENIIFPHDGARLATVYSLSYDALWGRIVMNALITLGLLVVSIVAAIFMAISLAKRLVGPLKILEGAVLKVGKGEFGAQAEIETDDEIGVLAENFNQMSTRLQKNTEELLEKEKLTKELSIAAEIQQNMLPEDSPKLDHLDISGSLTPATTIGGDIFDYLESEEAAYVFIADVTGHGVPAGMVANITHSSLYSYFQVYQNTDQIFSSMNQVIQSKTSPNMFATALLAKCDRKQRKISYCNAGHEQILWYHASSGKTEAVGKGGMALGMVPDLSKLLKENTLELEANDALFLYTDGIPEAWRSKEENLGMDRFTQMIPDVVQGSPSAQEMRDRLLAKVNGFRGKYPQQDDITLVVIKAL
jgi:serine phosphatase RsbU (regulator of sigma subunit)